MKAATAPRGRLEARRMAVIDASASAPRIESVADLPQLLGPGDLLVVNDAATVPASLRVVGEPLELRLLQRLAEGRWDAVALGPGDWRIPTENRPAPRALRHGERLAFEGGLTATVEPSSAPHPRRCTLHFDQAGESFWQGLYRAGRPVQYAYLSDALAPWDVQTAYADRPWALEAPSAGFALSWELILRLRARGVGFARLTHACGLSSTGEPALDAALPITERYEIPPETVEAVNRTRARCGRVVAVGTSVVRALESWAQSGERAGWTSLRIGPQTRLSVVDGILSGVHQPGESHHALLQAFAPVGLLDAAVGLAEREGLLAHEFGDAMLVLGRSAPADVETPAGSVSSSRPGARARRSRCRAAA